MIQRYGNREFENIFFVPVFLNLDCQKNYPKETIRCHTRTDQMIIRQNNSVHHADEGYRQIGDSIYSWLKLTFCL